MEKTKPTVKIEYLYDSEYAPAYANGAYGGIGPKGEITINFFFERNSDPADSLLEADENGNLTREVPIDPEDFQKTIVREVFSGVIVNKRTAMELRHWLDVIIKQGEALEEMQKNQGGKAS